jgi:ACS family glucarate transporter-like MFS transporter
VSATTHPRPDGQRPTNLRHLVLVALLTITAVNYIQRNSIAPAATTIEEELGISGRQLDLAAGAFFLAYTLLQVPSGGLAQRLGARLTLPIYAAGWSLALVGCSLASGFAGLYFGRLAMGAFQAGIFPCATLVLAVWYPASRRGLATALLNSFMLLGSAAGVALASPLLVPLGWRGIFLVYALPGLLWSAWFVWWFRNNPSEHPGVNQAELDLLACDRSAPKVVPADKGPRRATWALVLTSVPLLLLCAQQCFRAAANRLFDSRLPTYLERERLSLEQVSVPESAEATEEEHQAEVRKALRKKAALLASYPQWAGVVGGIIGGALSDFVLRRTGSRRLARNGLAIVSLLSASVVYLSAYFITDVILAVLVLSAGAFLFCFSSPCAYSLCIDVGGKYLAVVFGLMNMMGNLGAFAFVSSVMTLVGIGGWDFALAVWLGLHLLAAACWLFLDPNVVIGEPRLEKPS